MIGDGREMAYDHVYQLTGMRANDVRRKLVDAHRLLFPVLFGRGLGDATSCKLPTWLIPSNKDFKRLTAILDELKETQGLLIHPAAHADIAASRGIKLEAGELMIYGIQQFSGSKPVPHRPLGAIYTPTDARDSTIGALAVVSPGYDRATIYADKQRRDDALIWVGSLAAAQIIGQHQNELMRQVDASAGEQ